MAEKIYITKKEDFDAHVDDMDNPHGVTAVQIGAAASGHTHSVSDISDLTATATELNYTDGVTSNIQTQLNNKAASGHTHAASKITAGTFPATGIVAATGTDYTTARIRNIQASTTALTAGSSSLANGNIYLVYE